MNFSVITTLNTSWCEWKSISFCFCHLGAATNTLLFIWGGVFCHYGHQNEMLLVAADDNVDESCETQPKLELQWGGGGGGRFLVSLSNPVIYNISSLGPLVI